MSSIRRLIAFKNAAHWLVFSDEFPKELILPHSMSLFDHIA